MKGFNWVRKLFRRKRFSRFVNKEQYKHKMILKWGDEFAEYINAYWETSHYDIFWIIYKYIQDFIYDPTFHPYGYVPIWTALKSHMEYSQEFWNKKGISVDKQHSPIFLIEALFYKYINDKPVLKQEMLELKNKDIIKIILEYLVVKNSQYFYSLDEDKLLQGLAMAIGLYMKKTLMIKVLRNDIDVLVQDLFILLITSFIWLEKLLTDDTIFRTALESLLDKRRILLQALYDNIETEITLKNIDKEEEDMKST